MRKMLGRSTARTVPTAWAALAMPELRLIVWRLVCRSLAMIGVIGCSAAESTRYGTRAKITMAAVAG
jgi:hypothetical protein